VSGEGATVYTASHVESTGANGVYEVVEEVTQA
jgi:hypothetical protein